MRKEFQLTREELAELLKASEPELALHLEYLCSSVNQRNIDEVWKKLARQYLFVWDSVRPVTGKGQDFFTAVVCYDY